MYWRGSWLASVLLLSTLCLGAALRTFDDLQPIKKYARQTADDQLRSSLAVSVGILQRHNRVRDSQPLQQYINHLEQLLQQDCCDYFTALPLVNGITNNMKEVLDRKLPQELQPALRRSYVCAIWLLQRSRQFRWNSNKMHKPALAGFMRLFEAHLDVSVGRPISFHHISKSGGTSMCQLARVNGCHGPLMTRADNCLLNKGMDGPIWVMKHDPLLDNGIPPPPPPAPPAPPPPPPPPLSVIFGKDDDDDSTPAHKGAAGGSRRAGAHHTARSANDDGDSRWGDDDDEDEGSWGHPGAPDETESLFMDAAARTAGTLEPVPVEAMQWFMYDCNIMPKEKEGYGCGERQEAATAKSATFFANEHTLSFQHGEPQVCSAFTNLVMVREPLSEAVSLMSEVIQVYDRLLRRLSVQVWSPPRSDLVWWQRWAPVVVSSYATRTLLGPPAFCPPKDPPNPAAGSAAAAAAQRPQLIMLATGGAIMIPAGYVNPAVKWGEAWLYLSDDEVASALESLYAFDVVLELGSSELIDVSTSKLLGWDSESFSKQQPQRGVVAARVLTWQELQQLATQTPPATSMPPPGAAAATAAGQKAGQQQHNSPSTGKEGHGVLEVDVAKRMLAEAWVRRAFADVGVQYVITPLLPGHKLEQGPPSKAIAVAELALQRVNKTKVTVFANATAGGHVVVKVEVPAEAAAVRYTTHGTAAGHGHGNGTAPTGNGTAAAGEEAAGRAAHLAAKAGAAAAAASVEFYHLWPKHGVVLDEQQYHMLLKMTAADRQLHEHAGLLQLLDAGWLSVVSNTRGYSKLIKALKESDEDGAPLGCGFAGLNHMQ